jgi:hypothetical protein
MTARLSKRAFGLRYVPVANAIARLDLDQEDREAVAEALTWSLMPEIGSFAETFELLASDPLVPCAGFGDEPCPYGREIRIAMHLGWADGARGRSAAWQRRRPTVRCVSCGARNYRNSNGSR